MNELTYPILNLNLELLIPSEFAKGAINAFKYTSPLTETDSQLLDVDGCSLRVKYIDDRRVLISIELCNLSKLNQAVDALFRINLTGWKLSRYVVEEEKPQVVEIVTETEEPVEDANSATPYGLKQFKPEDTEASKFPSIGDKDDDGYIYVGKKEYESFTDLLYITRTQHSATGRYDDSLPTKYELDIILNNVFNIRGIMEPDKKLPVLGHYYWTQNSYLRTKGIAMKINEDGLKRSDNFGRSTQLGRVEIKRIRINKQ